VCICICVSVCVCCVFVYAYIDEDQRTYSSESFCYMVGVCPASVCMCVSPVCVCRHKTYILTYIHTYIHTGMQSWLWCARTMPSRYSRVCVCARAHICTHKTCIYAYIHTGMYAHIRHTHTHTYIQVCNHGRGIHRESQVVIQGRVCVCLSVYACMHT
jgi:hypothetical protein